MALTYHFVTVPALPSELRHQSEGVEVGEYLVRENESVNADTPVLVVRTWWAEMEILAGLSGYLVTTIFKSPHCEGGRIKAGDPVALILCDPEDGSAPLPDAERLRVVRHLHVRK